ncbi:DNA-binding protein [Kineobactrum sediminis]|uniref:DNA-binding protein n=1 Tax=Kineobactrum sediminis TaxID=1905677 RepID=A0A2N5Y1T2_9GAMM|nr:DnaJ C-terminal domain-containing protein [Kineobactrum sediminis]PLW82355.1 DNA-binding protein [Kineobactrum sediminis]
MEFKDYYKILGIEPDAELKDIKSAYRKLARKYHPDMNPGPESEEKFKEVVEAWEALKDPGRRAEYDELRRAGGSRQRYEPPPGWRSATGGFAESNGEFSDFFNSIFGNQFRQATGERRARGRPGQDVEMELPVFLEETLETFSKPVSYQLRGDEAGGQGRPHQKSLKVTIPAGVGDGERIRVRGQGVPGTGGAPPGDLYLNIRLVPHPLFDVEGHNLLVTVPVAPWEAALGSKITVPTLTGKISLTVPAGSQSGQKLRVPGKGLHGKVGRGDLYAVLKVVMPEDRSEEVTHLWQRLAEQAAFDPRAQWN